MIEVQEINSLMMLAEFRLHWNVLLAATPDRSFFHTYDWFVARVRDAGDSIRLRVLVVRDAGRPLGIVPLVVETRRRPLGTCRALCYPLDDWGAFYGPIGPAVATTLTAALNHIRHTPRDWDVLDLCWINKHGGDAGSTAAALQDCGFAPRESLHAQTAQVELGDWASYWASRKSHWRTNIRRSEKRLAALGEVTYLRYRPAGIALGEADPRWDLYHTCVDLAARSWQGQQMPGSAMSHAKVARLLRAAHMAAVRRGALDLNLLLLDDRPVAFAYNYHYDGYVYGLRSGFDRRACHEGAGSVLLCRALEDSCDRGDRLYDLGPDYFACKRAWWTRLTPVYRYAHFPWSAPKAQAMRLGRWLNRRLKSGV